VAIRVTVIPEGKLAEHVEPEEPQFIPAGLEVTLPPVGVGLMERVKEAARSAVSRATKASTTPPLLACAPPLVWGKLVEAVSPAT
jgi:hypothetical protein